MATIINDKDKILQAATVRLPAVLGNGIYFSTPAPVFKVTAAGVATPTSYDITAKFFGQLTGTVTWSIVSGTVTTAGQSGNTWTIAPAQLTTDSAVIRATLVYLGTAYTSDFTISKVIDGAAGAPGTNGVNGTRTAILDVYQWAASAPNLFPSGNSTYTWATGQFTAPATLNGWSITPSTSVIGQTLWIARTVYADSLVTSTSSVTWNATTAIPTAASGTNGTNGTNGSNGQRVGILEVYQWATSAPTTYPSGTSTYTWATGAFTAPTTPNSWSLTPGAPVPGQTLWGITAVVSDNLTTSTSTATWNSSTVYAVGAAGSSAVSAVLSSESFVFTASSTGAISSYVGSGITVRVYEGSTELVYDGIGTANSSWTLSSTATGITRGTIVDSGTFATVGNASGMADATDTASITYTVTGKTSAGVAFSLTKTQSFSKSKTGATGSGINGANGLSSLTAYKVQNQSVATAPTFTTTTAGATAPSGWSLTAPSPAVGEVVWYIDGRYNSSTTTIDGVTSGTTAWTGPVAASVFQDIRSDNWDGNISTGNYGTAGYYLQRSLGNIYVNSGLFRGNINCVGNGTFEGNNSLSDSTFVGGVSRSIDYAVRGNGYNTSATAAVGSVRAGVYGITSSLGASGKSTWNVGVLGKASMGIYTAGAVGVVGDGYTAGGYFSGSAVGLICEGTGVVNNGFQINGPGNFIWNNYVIPAPTGGTTTFLRNDGTWAAITGGSGGTVTSVTGTGTVSGLTLSGTVTTTGNLTLSGTLAVTASNFASQTAATVLAAPNAAAGTPTFRALVAADIPTLNQSTTGTAANVTGTVAIANGGTGSTNAAAARTALGAGTVTSVGGTGTVSGLTLSGSVTGSGNLTLSGTLSLTASNLTATAPGAAYYLRGSGWESTNNIMAGAGTNSGTALVSGNVLNFYTGTGLTAYQFVGSGNTVTLQSVSDKRLKENILPEILGLDFINLLKPVQFNRIGQTIKHHGFLADDLQELVPDTTDSFNQTYSDGTKGLDYIALLAPLVKAVQELTAKVNSLEQQLQAVK